MTLRRARPAFISMVAGLLVLHAMPLRAQFPAHGGIAVQVQDSAGDPLSNALVRLTETRTGLVRDATTGRDGLVDFRFLAPGEYRLLAERLGFRPGVVTSILARTGDRQSVIVKLRGGTASPAAMDSVAFDGAALRNGPPGWRHRVPMELAEPPRRADADLASLALLFSNADDGLGIEGLPGSFSALVLDGIAFRPARHPLLPTHGLSSTAFSLEALGSGDLLTGTADARWSGAAGGILSAQSRRAPAGVNGAVAGAWAGSVNPVQSYNEASFNQFQGLARISRTSGDGSNSVTAGIEAKRLRTPLAAAWPDSPAAAQMRELASTRGLDFQANLQPQVVPADEITAFAQGDWWLGTQHQLHGAMHVSSLPAIAIQEPILRFVPRLQGTDVVAGLALRSSFAEHIGNEAEIAFTRSTRRRDVDALLPLSWIVSDDLVLGSAQSGDAEEQVFRMRNSLSLRRGAHALEVGGSVDVFSHRFEQASAASSYFFGSVGDFAAGEGVLVRSVAPRTVADWSTVIPGVFLQDRWNGMPGVEVRLGAHIEREPLPHEDVQRDDRWYQLTRLANDSVQSAQWHISPRLGVTWDVKRDHALIVHGAAGVFYDRVDPLLLAAWQLDDGTAGTARVIGAIAWPDAGTLATTPRLTLLAPGIEAPRTARLSAGLSYRLGAAAAVHLSLVARRTEGLPRRSDVNLLPLPALRDQYGRGVYGNLAKRGALLAQQPGTGRRFAAYDEVAGITSDGESDYRGATIALESEPRDGLMFIARYTLSSTTDNWFGGRIGGWTVAVPQGLDTGSDWSDGRSDFDARHRAVVGGVVTLGPAMRFIGSYRVQSGQAFTPGFRAGVDANADGVANNDPAFVDAQLPGIESLMSRWECLRAAAGAFAERNSCRGPATHSVDVGGQLRLVRGSDVSAAIELNITNVLATARREPDTALYLVTPELDLSTDATTRTVQVPLTVNPRFGEPVAQQEAGRRMSLGIRVNW